MGWKLNAAIGTGILVGGVAIGIGVSKWSEKDTVSARKAIGSLVAPLVAGIAEGAEDFADSINTDSREDVNAELKELYDESLVKFADYKIKKPKLLALLRTSGMDGRDPVDRIPFSKEVKAKKERIKLFFAIAFPKGEQKVPVVVRWERNGESFDRMGDEYEGQGHRYRLNISERFPVPGTWTVIIEADGKEVGREDIEVVR